MLTLLFSIRSFAKIYFDEHVLAQKSKKGKLTIHFHILANCLEKLVK